MGRLREFVLGSALTVGTIAVAASLFDGGLTRTDWIVSFVISMAVTSVYIFFRARSKS